ncbi:beta-ketoacyl-[acyl-carrier-protein] synthase family protein [Streptomyces murinus]|uniref:hypothetical protein n=1 Tax=Streptomyces murinus TaxID=33900 RepID=UPI003826E651
MGINLDYLAAATPVAGFSCDLMNGACGVLNAVQVAQALLVTGSTDRVLITAADVHPGGRAADDPAYPYADLGAALLLERGTEPGTGFGLLTHQPTCPQPPAQPTSQDRRSRTACRTTACPPPEHLYPTDMPHDRVTSASPPPTRHIPHHPPMTSNKTPKTTTNMAHRPQP